MADDKTMPEDPTTTATGLTRRSRSDSAGVVSRTSIQLVDSSNDWLTPVSVLVYPDGELMRQEAMKLHLDDPVDGALAVTQYDHRRVIIRFNRRDLCMRVIVHECLHAALVLDDMIVDDWRDEGLCHIMDDLFVKVLAWLIDDLHMSALGLELEEEETTGGKDGKEGADHER